MNTIFAHKPRIMTLAEAMSFEILKAQALGNVITSFLITDDELTELKATSDEDAFVPIDWANIQEGTHFLGVPLIISNGAYDEKELRGYEAAGKVVNRLKLN